MTQKGIRFIYNTAIKRIIDPIGRVQSYTYDGQGRLTGVTDFLQQTTRYVWDVRGDGSDPTDLAIRNAGHIVRKIDPGVPGTVYLTLDTLYPRLNEPATKEWSHGQDGAGRSPGISASRYAAWQPASANVLR